MDMKIMRKKAQERPAIVQESNFFFINRRKPEISKS
jgi:hypothetical protein